MPLLIKSSKPTSVLILFIMCEWHFSAVFHHIPLLPILLVMTKVVSVVSQTQLFLCSFSTHLGPLLVVQFFDKLVCVLCKAFSAQLSWWIVKLFCLVIVNNYGIIDEKKCHFCCCAEFLLRKRQLLRVLFWILLLAL